MSDHQSAADGASPEPMASEFADDPDMVELIEYFLEELQPKISALREAFQQQDKEMLARLAHQLKGAAGGYGYPSISSSAAAVEKGVTTDEAQLSDVSERVEQLILLCRRAAAGYHRAG